MSTAIPITLQRVHRSRERPSELVEETLGAILFRYRSCVGQCLCASHERIVNCGHLRRQHDLKVIPRFDAFDHRNHEIDRAFVNLAGPHAAIAELAQEAAEEVIVYCPKGFHEQYLTKDGIRMVN